MRARHPIAFAAAIVGLLARMAVAGTSLWVSSEAGEPVGGGVTRTFSSADGSFTGYVGTVVADSGH